MYDVVPGRTPDPEEAELLYERYRGPRSRPLRATAYYAVKPLIPRTMQLAARRTAARHQTHVAFPAWPIEPALLRRRAHVLSAELQRRCAERLPVVNLWPGEARFAFVLTHDVESRTGVERIEELLDVERRYGFVSSWNFCAGWYPLERAELDAVRRAGCEVGLHGIRHDGRLFGSRAAYVSNLRAIRDYMEAWGAVGFRSPSLGRNAAWMHELPCRYDSSFPDTDPFEAQPGGCCSIHPYFFGDVVELPITLDQDFTLFELLRERSIDLWVRKIRWIKRHRGLVNVLVHPDYMTPERLRLYEELLAFLSDQEGGWHALPREVAEWWRTRDALRCVGGTDGEVRVEGEGAEAAGVAWARTEGEEISYDT
jgi:peptidoglycan/xylan/chitin deacetylase (PgdA/CDA1 family)